MMTNKPKPLTPWQLELLAEYDETVANRAEDDRKLLTLAAMRKRLEPLAEGGSAEAGLLKLAAREIDADEAAALVSLVAGERMMIEMNYGACGNNPAILDCYHLRQALAKREALERAAQPDNVISFRARQ